MLVKSGLVTVRIRLKCPWVYHTLAVHKLILFGLLFRLDGVILGLSYNMIGLAYSGLTSSFGQRFLNVIQNVLFKYRKVQLFATFAVERDSADFAFLFTLTGLVAVILGAA